MRGFPAISHNFTKGPFTRTVGCAARCCARLVKRLLCFSERVRLSVCLSSVCHLQRSCTLLSRLKFSAIFLRRLVPWPSVDIRGKFYGDRQRGTIPSGGLNVRGVAKYSNFHLWNAVTPKRCKIGGKLVLITNRKSYMSFRLVSKSVTFNDLERRNGPYFALFFYRIWQFQGRIA